MHRITPCFIALVCAATAAASPAPTYELDPFGDSDFRDAPLILDQAHPSAGRIEVGTAFAFSVIDQYSSHLGGNLELSYHPWDTLAFGLSLGFLHGRLSNIVTDPGGIIVNKVRGCTGNPKPDCLQPAVPDYTQMTGGLDAVLVWAPLYGKVNLVSELDVNLQLYGLAGGGVNGRRTITAALGGDNGFSLSSNAFGDGGFLGDMTAHWLAGVGAKIFLASWLMLRAEARDVMYVDEFVFDETVGLESYVAHHWLVHVGLGLAIQ